MAAVLCAARDRRGDPQTGQKKFSAPRIPCRPGRSGRRFCSHLGRTSEGPGVGISELWRQLLIPGPNEVACNFLRSRRNKTGAAWVSQYVADAQAAIRRFRLTPGAP
jgi:hypothetical protein